MIGSCGGPRSEGIFKVLAAALLGGSWVVISGVRS